MSSFCTAKATHIFQQKYQHICVSLDVNFNESLTNDIASFEQLGPGVRVADSVVYDHSAFCIVRADSTLFAKAYLSEYITKTRLFKYKENFTSKNRKLPDKNSDIFF